MLHARVMPYSHREANTVTRAQQLKCFAVHLLSLKQRILNTTDNTQVLPKAAKIPGYKKDEGTGLAIRNRESYCVYLSAGSPTHTLLNNKKAGTESQRSFTKLHFSKTRVTF